jgi:type II secretory pathway predicted ATPase ExeA
MCYPPRRKPIVLMVDEAHDLHHHTLIGLKRLIEMVADGAGKLSVLLATPSCVATCATRQWKRSATAPRCSR